MTVTYDSGEDAVVANNAGEYVTLTDDGELHIDITYIMSHGRAERKLTEWLDAFQAALMERVK